MYEGKLVFPQVMDHLPMHTAPRAHGLTRDTDRVRDLAVVCCDVATRGYWVTSSPAATLASTADVPQFRTQLLHRTEAVAS